MVLPKVDEWTQHFPIGPWMSGAPVNFRIIGNTNVGEHTNPNATAYWHRILNHPEQGLRAAHMNYSFWAGAQPYNMEDVQEICSYLDTETSGPMHKVIWGPEGRTDQFDNNTGVANDWFNRAPELLTYENALIFAQPIIDNFKDHPSIIGYKFGDDIQLSHDADAAFPLMRAFQDLDPYGRPVLIPVSSFAGLAGTDADYMKCALFYAYPSGKTTGGVTALEGDFHRNTFDAVADLGGGGGDYVDLIRAKYAAMPERCQKRFQSLIQCHKTPDSLTSVRYPTWREIQKNFWILIGEGTKGIWYFTWDGDTEASGLGWYGIGDINKITEWRTAARLAGQLTPEIRRTLLKCDPLRNADGSSIDLFETSGGGSTGYPNGKNYPSAYKSTLQHENGTYYLVLCNNALTDATPVTVTSTALAGTLRNMTTGDTFQVGESVNLDALAGGIWELVPGVTRYWYGTDYDRRIIVSATNAHDEALHDYVLPVAVPADLVVDPDSLTAVEMTALDTVDRAFDWRYGGTSVNHVLTLPVGITGDEIRVKALGRWEAAETRRFGLYWDSTSAVTPFDFDHLGKVSEGWTASITAGTTGDSYVINAGGETYTHVMTAGQTSGQIGLALKALINAGSVALATGGGSVQTIAAVDVDDLAFTVTNTGSTVPGNMPITVPAYFTVSRRGPDTVINAQPSGFPRATGSAFMTRPGWSDISTNRGIRSMSYGVNGVGTFVTSSGTLGSVTDTGPSVAVTGGIVFPTRSGDVDWTASYTADARHVWYRGRKADDTNAGGVLKTVNLSRIVLTYVCNRAYTPTAIASNLVTPSNFDLITLGSGDTNFGGGIESITNQIPRFRAPAATGVIATYAASDDLSALPVVDTIFGNHGNINCIGVRVNSVALTNFGSQAPEAKWCSDTSGYARLQLRNLSSAATIPVGATITVDFWLALNTTGNALTEGDVLLPDELVTLLRGAGEDPVVAREHVAQPTARDLLLTMKQASDAVRAACAWQRDHGEELTTVANNGAYKYHVDSGALETSDDHDGNYGEAFKLHGLCLYYLRTHDTSVIPEIEAQVRFHIQIERDMVATYGEYWSGTAPYWYWPSPIGTSEFVGVGDPSFNGGAGGNVTYVQGQVRMWSSIDQMHMVAHGMYAYRFLLRNEPLITGNVQLWADALALIGRMSAWELGTQESFPIPNTSRQLTNLYRICQDLLPTEPTANGLNGTTSAYMGLSFNRWQILNISDENADANSNVTIDTFFGGVFANDGDLDSARNYLRGRAMDMMVVDYSRHDEVFAATEVTRGRVGPYPKGWAQRAQTGNTVEYAATRTVPSNHGFSTDLHWLEITNNGGRDSMSGRSAQRLVAFCLLALIDPTITVPAEMAANGTTVLREYPIRQVIDEMAATIALYGPEPTTEGGARQSALGYLGATTSAQSSRFVDSAFTGYWMMACELWHLVNSGASHTDYYPVGDWTASLSPTWQDLGVVAEIAAVSTVSGRVISALQEWNGRIYIGYGDYGADEPDAISAIAWDTVSESYLTLAGGQLNSNCNFDLRIVNNELWMVANDAGFGTFLEYAVISPSHALTIVNSGGQIQGHHLFDSIYFNGKAYICGAAYVDGVISHGAVWRKDATWVKAVEATNTSNQAAGYRFHTLFVLGSTLYVAPYNAPLRTTTDGTTWTTTAIQLIQVPTHAINVTGGVLYKGIHGPGGSASTLYRFNGTTQTTPIASGVRGHCLAPDGTPYAVKSTEVWQGSADGVTWNMIHDDGPTNMTAIAVTADAIYVGTADSHLWRLML